MDQTLNIPLPINQARPAAHSRALSHPLLWTVFIVYVLVLAYTAMHHEPWGDEIHSWNISKASGSFQDVVHNSRFEGHPPGWYTVLWTISKFTHNFAYVQVVHVVLATLVVFVILFFSPFPLFARLMVPFGYYFLYEFAVLSRNYALGVLAAICICMVMRKSFRFKWPLYYFLLLLMSNTHMLALILAGSLHLYFLMMTIEQKGKIKAATIPVLFGALIFLPAVYFISPPSDSQLSVQFWMDRWNTVNIKASGQTPLRSLIPVPAWWEHSSWNTNFLLDADNKRIIVNFFVAMALLGSIGYVLKNNRKALVVFGANFFLSILFAIFVFPLSSARYSGFVYIGFITALWLYCYESPLTNTRKWLVGSLLGLQIVAASISVVKDFRFPFSNASRVNEVIARVPPGERAVTDYWAVNTISTFADRPFYCIDLQEEISFLQWGVDLGKMSNKPYRYTDGLRHLFGQTGRTKVYLISGKMPEMLFKEDTQLDKTYQVKLVYKIEGAIEKGGNLYLYKIERK